MFADALDVFCGKQWTSGLTTVGTRQTICLGKDFVVYLMNALVQILGWAFLKVF